MRSGPSAGLGLVVLALLACKGGGGNDGTYTGPCTVTVQWDFDLRVPHDCALTIAGSNVKLEMTGSLQYPVYVCSGTLEGDKVEGTCPILDGRGQEGVSHCLENQKYPTFTVRKQGEKMFFEIAVSGTASPSTCPPIDEKLRGYRLTGELSKK
jgi:hypothetical protein